MTSTTSVSLLDEILPEFDVSSRHAWLVAAPPDAVWRAIERYDPSRDASLLARGLFRLRGLRMPRGRLRDALVGSGFSVLAEREAEEIVLGTTGRFWAMRERANMQAPPSLDAFVAFERPGWAKAALSLRIEPREQGWSKLVTETRVRCVDETARRRFSVYWKVIEVFSGWLRRDLLRQIARIAESAR